jgi:hypothetical protein
MAGEDFIDILEVGDILSTIKIVDLEGVCKRGHLDALCTPWQKATDEDHDVDDDDRAQVWVIRERAE